MGSYDVWGYSGMGWGGLFVFSFLVLLVVWTLYWKYHALWYAAKHDEKWWFIALLVINTAGILEIIYLCVITKKTPSHDDKNLPMVP